MNLLVRERRVGGVIAKIVMLPEGVEKLDTPGGRAFGCGISNVKKHLGNKDTEGDFIQLVKKYRKELERSRHQYNQDMTYLHDKLHTKPPQNPPKLRAINN